MATNLNADEVLINADKVYNFTANFDTDPALEKLIVQQLHKDSSLTSGTGTYIPFLNQNATGNDISSQGFNTSDAAAKANNNGKGLDMSNTASTTAIQLKDIPLVIGPDGNRYYEIRLDINEENNDHLDSTGQSNRLLELSEFQLYWSSRQATLADYDAANYTIKAFADSSTFHLAFDIDANTDRSIILRDSNPGGGKDDYIFYIPADTFEGASPDSFITLFSQFGPSPSEGATPEEWRIRTTSQIDGMKFEDKDSDQVKDGDENGVPGVTIQLYQDTGNGVLDASDYLISTTVTGAGGAFSFYSLLPGTYFVKEVVPAGAVVTTGEYETVIITTPGQDVSGVQIGNHYLTPHIDIQKSAEIDGDNDCADSTDETITYTITVTNDGELALSNVVVTDTFEGGAPVIIDDGDGTLEPGELVRSGDVGNDNILSVGETWTYTYNRAVTQADIDSNGLDGDGLLSNVAAVSATSANGSVNDSDGATVDVCPLPDFTAVKSIVSVNDGPDAGGDNGLIDGAGDSITYQIVITNTGNVTLDLGSVTDTFEGVPADIVALMTESLNDDNQLEVGETWTYQWTETVNQAELDEICATDETITNTVAATFTFGDPQSEHYFTKTDGNTVNTPVECTPDFTAVKSIVSVNDGPDAGGDNGLIDGAGDSITYQIVITNTGNVTLDLGSVTDTFEGVPADIVALMTESLNDDNQLEVGETWTYQWTETVNQAELDEICATDETITNTVAATFTFGDPQSEHYFTKTDGNTVNTPVECTPDFTAVKSIVSVNDGPDAGGDNGLIDGAGDSITYQIVITNTGNVTLDLGSVTDTFEGVPADIVALMTESLNDDNQLEVGETWTYQWTETVNQAELDEICATDETITNTVAATFTFGDPQSEHYFTKTDGNTVNTPVECTPDFTAVKSIVSVNDGPDAGGDNGLIDGAGDSITYQIVITNTGNVTLDLGSVTDTFEGVPADIVALMTESLNDDNQLEVGETWTYQWTETVNQAELDEICATDETITNTVAATFTFGDPQSEHYFTKTDGNTVNTPVECTPDFTAVKSIVSVNDGPDAGGDNGLIDGAGDSITYQIVITNTGNVTLDLGSVTDTFEGVPADIVALMTESLNDDNQLEVGETWTYQWTETVNQAELDEICATDETITNTVAATFTFGDPQSEHYFTKTDGNTVNTPVECTPSIDVEKSVKTNLMADYTEEDYDDDPGDLQASTSTEVQFRVVVQNTGNVTLSNITLTDSVVHTVGGVAQAAQGIVYTPDGDNTTLDAFNVFVDLDNSGDRNLDGSEDWINFDTDGDGTIDAGVIAELSPNESFTLYYSLTSEFGQHENTASVYGSIGADTVSDSDDANYYVLAEDCGPGVRTPGFWSNLGWGFWDGKEGLPKQAGQDGFADHEFNVLVYGKDTDNDGDIDLNDSPVQGLLIGDWNLDGIIQVNGADGIAGTADDEDNVLFISLKDAQNLINASNKDLKGDATFMLGRDVVATWLNYMAGNGIDNPGTSDDAFSPKHYLDEAIDWLQTWAGKNGNGSVANLADNDKTETFDTYVANHATVKNSTSQWQTAQFGDHSAAQIHTALDGYNNDGVINGVEFACDADNDYALLALSQIA